MQAVIEKNRRYLVIKGGGLAWKLSREGGVVNTVVVLCSAASVSVSSERRGGRNSKYGANKASKNITRQYTVLGMP